MAIVSLSLSVVYSVQGVYMDRINYYEFSKDYYLKLDYPTKTYIENLFNGYFVPLREKRYFGAISLFSMRLRRYYVLNPEKFQKNEFKKQLDYIYDNILVNETMLKYAESRRIKVQKWRIDYLRNNLSDQFIKKFPNLKKYSMIKSKNDKYYKSSFLLKMMRYNYIEYCIIKNVSSFPELSDDYNEKLELFHTIYNVSYNGDLPKTERIGFPIGYGYDMNIENYFIYLIIGNEEKYLKELFDNEIKFSSALFPNKEQAILFKKYILGMKKWFRTDKFKKFMIENIDRVIESKESCEKLHVRERSCYKGNATVPVETYGDDTNITN